MSQEQINAFLAYLKNHPEEQRLLRKRKVDFIVGYAAARGYTFTAEELQARQALDYLARGI